MKSKISFTLYRGEISTIFFINKQDRWECKKGKFKGQTILSLIQEYGVDEVLEYLYSNLEHEDCVGIEKEQIKEIIFEIKKSQPLKFLKF